MWSGIVICLVLFYSGMPILLLSIWCIPCPFIVQVVSISFSRLPIGWLIIVVRDWMGMVWTFLTQDSFCMSCFT